MFLLPLFGQAQSLDYDTTFADGAGYNWKASVHLPADYYTSNKYYKLIMFIPGTGEIGGGYPALDTYGPLAYIDGGWNGGVLLGNGTHYPILIALEPWTDYATTGSRTATVVNAIVNRYRVQPGCVYATGLSAGGYAWKVMVTYDSPDTSPPYGPFSNADKIAALFDLQGVIPDVNADWYNRVRNFANNQYAGQYFGIWDNLDAERGIARFKDSMNAAVSGSGRVIVTNNGHTATAWNAAYGSSSGAAPVNYTIDGISQTIYQWLLRQGDTTFMTSGSSIITDAGTDYAIVYDQNGAARSFTLTGGHVGGSSPTYSWSALAGNPSATSIISPSSSVTLVTGATAAGYYGYVLTVSDGVDSDTDTVYVQLRDLMKRGLRPCRTGDKQKFYIGDQLIPGRVTTTEIYLQHITRDGYLTNVQGGDTVVIHRNLNNDTGYWRAIHLGDISGSPGCPIVFVPDTSGMTVVSGPMGTVRGWYIATADGSDVIKADSNTVAYVKFDGGAWYNKTGIRHGFRADNRAYPYDSSNTVTHSLNMGMSIHLAHHLEVTGFAVWNAGYMFQVKIYSDSAQPFTIYNNFIQRGNWFHHNYAWKTNYEGQYLGHTDWDGSYQSGNDGPTLIQDSTVSEYNVFVKIGQDMIQFSNHKYGAIARNNVGWNVGYRNVSSHRWGIFIGGNANGNIYGNTIVRARGPIGAFNAYGPISIYNNIVDSVDDGSNVENGYYASSNARWALVQDTMRVFFENNLLRNIAQTGNYSHGRVINDSGRVKKGAIRNNLFQHPTKTLISQLVTSAANDTISGNIIVSAVNIDTSSLGSMDSWRMYELLKTVPDGTPVSFYDLPSLVQPHRGFRIKGKRLRFKIN